ncbi:MAG: 5'/3'-nucleotidase SurE [Chloroflexota bacterium]|nr:5'/3'-nucleotidase SurE [Chloroflexota bacterium]
MPAHRTTATPNPLILITNDDGISSPGLRAAVRAALPLGEILVAAPARQWSGAGRSMPPGPEGHTSPYSLEGEAGEVTAYQVDDSPASVVARAVLQLAPRRPALVVSGINYGENMGTDVTISGTVGAALQGAAFGIPALAVSLQTPKETHTNPSDSVDFTAAIHFTRLFARWMLQTKLPFDVDALKIDLPDDATPATPWRLTRVSRHTYFVGVPPLARESNSPLIAEGAGGGLDYEQLPHPERTEPDSDIYALAVDRVVSIAPLSMDLTSRSDRREIEALLRGPAPR